MAKTKTVKDPAPVEAKPAKGGMGEAVVEIAEKLARFEPVGVRDAMATILVDGVDPAAFGAKVRELRLSTRGGKAKTDAATLEAWAEVARQQELELRKIEQKLGHLVRALRDPLKDVRTRPGKLKQSDDEAAATRAAAADAAAAGAGDGEGAD